jgi:hypothetical protein
MLEKNDKKTISLIVIEALDTLIIPRLEIIDKDIKGLKEDVSDLHNTTNRIELKLNAVVKVEDEHSDKIVNLNKRVLKLEHKA